MTIDIDKLETLRAAATQGPFEHVTPPGYSFGFVAYYVEHEGERLRSEFPANDADDAYTVELLNAAPALFSEIKWLRAEVQRLSTMAFSEADEYVTRMRGTP